MAKLSYRDELAILFEVRSGECPSLGFSRQDCIGGGNFPLPIGFQSAELFFDLADAGECRYYLCNLLALGDLGKTQRFCIRPAGCSAYQTTAENPQPDFLPDTAI